jgi:hypothetical protein
MKLFKTNYNKWHFNRYWQPNQKNSKNPSKPFFSICRWPKKELSRSAAIFATRQVCTIFDTRQQEPESFSTESLGSENHQWGRVVPFGWKPSRGSPGPEIHQKVNNFKTYNIYLLPIWGPPRRSENPTGEHQFPTLPGVQYHGKLYNM